MASFNVAPKDYSKALKWFQIAFDKHKDYGSLYWFAIMHRDGLGVKKDLNKAKELFTIAAENGVKEALAALDRNQAK
ncbi:MAG: hypothetical protein LBP89_06410 [Helicobacteraceae bacterium]|jgi:TPR repeat protein|nr:hypothetical protein [Helicobacteraceae bacterium]